MRTLMLYILSSMAFACNSRPNTADKTASPAVDGFARPSTQKTTSEPSDASHEIPRFDSIPLNYLPDNINLRKKREEILTAFSKNVYTPGALYDTLVDLNYDQHRDFIIGYYGLSGTGLKHRVRIYLYSKSRNDYILNNRLSELVNPSFFIRDKKITAFYLGHGGGQGQKLEWLNGKWTLTKEFTVDNDGDGTVWKVFYPADKKEEKISLPFQMIPPPQILETNRRF
jgi:hypothetical protein